MKAIIVNYGGGLRIRHNRDVIIRPIGKVERALIGAKVIWRNTQSGGRTIGKVVDTHGRYGYHARFSRNLPGWAIGTQIDVF
jgi:ribosomal protein L35AE/L33A